MKISVKILVISVVLTLAGGVLLGWAFFGSGTGEDHAHTEIVDGETVWTCSMHPQIRQNEPGNCPICGMELIPLEEEDVEAVDPLAISMSSTAMQLASITTAKVRPGPAVKTIRLTGKVQEDERMVYSQTTHFPGRIERLLVNFTGKFVTKGTTIAELYSPELVTAQEELLEAYKIRESQPNLYKAAREKLKNWKISESRIDQILSSGRLFDNFPVKADYSGYVVEKYINLGDHLMTGQPLYDIANLSQVWVLFDVHESEIPWINKGDSISFGVSSLPGRTFKAKIDYIDPIINPKTRVSHARVVVQNDNQLLKPEMFVSGVVDSKIGRDTDHLTVPRSSVMWTGERSVVYVKLQTDQGVYFKMREVTLGPALGDAYIVEDGLEAGEEIAVHGTFSIDAAAQLAGKPSMMAPEGRAAITGHDHGQGSINTTFPEMNYSQQVSENPEPNKSDRVFEVNIEFRNQIKNVFQRYLTVKDALIASDVETASREARALKAVINGVEMELVEGEAHIEWMKDLEVLQRASGRISDGNNLDQIRIWFSTLSDQLFYSLQKFQVDVDGFRQFCPMAMDNEGAYWLSNSKKILNPYFGEAMLTCGNVEEEL